MKKSVFWKEYVLFSNKYLKGTEVDICNIRLRQSRTYIQGSQDWGTRYFDYLNILGMELLIDSHSLLYL